MSQSFLTILQIIVGVLLITLVLLQQRGSGMGALGGLTSQFYGTRRGLEKTIFISTIVLGALFILLAIVSFLI
ncbi:MAG: preprotein translocase subunit SecG [Candidatus Pacebacteria bacterium]|jgi:protein translocase SecG subunit|nr:preprotein translocase subunit SecG [Candidatus Paceibacterota bacterium]MDD3491641.1 preprotein translocase subunit SecG [Candidatus Paceibacterota bacterium]MDD5721861.1 preprotein translocase subunit SecG [Candidatus Paceibacterota bacterium]